MSITSLMPAHSIAAPLLVGGAERRAAGAAEAVDANPDGHVLPPDLGNVPLCPTAGPPRHPPVLRALRP